MNVYMSKIFKFIQETIMKFNLVMNCYVFIEIFDFFRRGVETLCNLHNSVDAFIDRL